MILRRVRIQQFRSLRDLEVQLGPGLNVVRGPNEAGKSTLQAALVALLFADPSRRNQEIEAMRSWGAHSLPVLSAELASPAQEYSLLKDFEGKQTELRLPDGSLVKDRKRISQLLTELLGVASRSVYEATACLLQQQWAEVSAGAELRELLQQSLSGGAEGAGAEAIVAKLDKAIESLERGLKAVAPKNPGELAQTVARRKQVEEKLSVATQEAAVSERLSATMAEAKENLKAINAELERLRSLQQKADLYRKLDREVGELREQADAIAARLEHVERLEKECVAIERGLQQRPHVEAQVADDVIAWHQRREELKTELADLRNKIEQQRSELQRLQHMAATFRPDLNPERLYHATHLQKEADTARSEAAQAAQAADQHEADLRAGTRRARWRRGLLAAAAGVAAVGIILALLWHPMLLALEVLALALGTAGALQRPPADLADLPQRVAQARATQQEATARADAAERELAALLDDAGCADLDALAAAVADQQRQLGDLRAQIEAARGELRAREEQEARTQAQVEELEHNLNQALKASGVESVERLVEEARSREQAVQELRDRRQQIEGALGGESKETLEARLRQLSLDFRAREHEMESPELAGAHLSPEAYQDLVMRLDELEAQRVELSEELHQADLQRARLQYDMEQVRALEGERQDLLDRERLLQERLAAYHLARDTIAQALREVTAEASESLGPRMGQLLADMTGNRYTQVTLDSDMRPLVTVPETGEKLPASQPGSLSCATREQVFLAARLGIIEFLWPDGGPPLLMDDPLVNFDSDRRAAALKVIKELAASRQVILFTCGHDYDHAADRVVALAQVNEPMRR